MKRVTEQSLYEILEVPPGAPPPEIELAYERARSLYGADSLALYTLLDPDDAALLARRIEEARSVLLDPQARAGYDATLAGNGIAVRSGLAPATSSSGLLPPVLAPPAPAPPPAERPVEQRNGAAKPSPAATETARHPGAEPAHAAQGPAASPTPPAEPTMAPAPTPPLAPADAPRPSITPLPEITVEVTPAIRASAPEPVAPPPAPAREVQIAVAPRPPEPAPAVEFDPEPTSAVASRPPEPRARPEPPARTAQREFTVPEGAAWTGELLRKVREARGMSLQLIAERTKVTRHHLENIEADRYEALPAPVYLRGILMSFAKELRLDGQKVARCYLEIVRTAMLEAAAAAKPR